MCSGNGKADVLGALTSDRLQDDVYVDFAGSQRGENSESDARLVRNLDDRDAGDVVVESDPFDKHFFHFANLLDNGARHIAVDARAHFHLNRIFFRHFHRAVVQNIGAAGGKLEHLVVGNLVELVGIGDDARVGGVYAVHIGVDFTFICLERSCNGDCTGVAAAASEGGDVIVAV